MKITDLCAQSGVVHRQAAELLVEGFDHPRGWSSLETATREVEGVLRQGFAFAALEDSQLLGWIGGLPEYDGRVCGNCTRSSSGGTAVLVVSDGRWSPPLKKRHDAAAR